MRFMRMVLVMAGLALSVAGCTGDDAPTSKPPSELDGVWVLSSFVLDGLEQTVDAEAQRQYGRTAPWFSFESGDIGGFAGCNVLAWGVEGDPYEFQGGILTFFDVGTTAIACEGETAEPAVQRALEELSDGVDVTFSESSMTWSGSSIKLVFERAPHPPPLVWHESRGVGSLNCPAGQQIVRSPVEAMLDDKRALLQSQYERVSGILGSDPAWWGHSPNGIVIIGLIRPESDPASFVIVMCE